MMSNNNNLKEIVLGGGCFWCLEAVFQQVPGVKKVISGYCGGHVKNPTYEDICTGLSGHAEVVQIFFEPTEVLLEQLLKIFWQIHDPTTPNRQGYDIGSQYRSIIFYKTTTEEKIIRDVKETLTEQNIWSAPIITQILAAETFYSAEAEHQNYYQNNPWQGYCQAIIKPKLDKLKKIVPLL